MKEELRHIDLIDRYLSGELNPKEEKEVQRLLSEDSEFAKEVEVFKQMYKGVELQAEDKIRKKLKELYREYQRDQQKSQKTKGLYRRLIIYGGAIAASVVIGTFFYINKQQATQSAIGDDAIPTVVDVDSLKTQTKDTLSPDKKNTELVEEEKDRPKDTVQIDFGKEEVQMAFSNAKNLSSEAVREVSYPSGALSYVFDGKKLSLFGDPTVSGLQLKLGKNAQGDYFMEFKGRLYSLNPTETKKALNQIEGPYAFQNPLGEELEIQIQSILAGSRASSDLIVKVASNPSLRKEYYFTEQNGKKVLFVDADMDVDEMKVVILSKKEGDVYYILHDTTLYQIQSDTEQMTPLKEMDFTANIESRMLMERPSFTSEVYQLSLRE